MTRDEIIVEITQKLDSEAIELSTEDYISLLDELIDDLESRKEAANDDLQDGYLQES